MEIFWKSALNTAQILQHHTFPPAFTTLTINVTPMITRNSVSANCMEWNVANILRYNQAKFVKTRVLCVVELNFIAYSSNMLIFLSRFLYNLNSCFSYSWIKFCFKLVKNTHFLSRFQYNVCLSFHKTLHIVQLNLPLHHQSILFYYDSLWKNF